MPVVKMKRSEDSPSDYEIWRKIQRNGSFRVKKANLINGNVADQPIESISDFEMRLDPLPPPLDQEQHSAELDPVGSDESNFTENIDLLSGDYALESDDDNGEFAYVPEHNPIDLREELQNWGIEHQIKHTAINALLKILKIFIPNNALPKDARTLLKTPSKIAISSNPELDGKYWHRGLQIGLLESLKNVETLPASILLNINIDGLPISKSTTTNFWPILVNLHETKQVPFAVGVFCGSSTYLGAIHKSRRHCHVI